MKKYDQMAVEKVPKLLLKFSLPAIIGLIVNALYNIVDSIFVGRGVGDLGLAGVTVSFPIVTTFMACVMLIGMGATSLSSIRLGENKSGEAEQIMGNAFVLLVIVGVSLSILGLIFLKPLLIFFGASPDVLPYAMDYLRIILLGNVLFAIGTGMNNFIRAEGNPRTAMNTMLIGTVTNIILDYVFIFIFHWGIKGAAAATIISYGVSSTWVLYYFFARKSSLRMSLENLRPKKTVVKGIFIVGFPTFILQVTNSVQQLILNRSLVYYGGDMALAVIGVIMSITMFLVMPAMGISQGAQPIIGYNYGAKQFDRVKETLKLSIMGATAIVTFGFVITKIWPAQLIGLFNKNPQFIDLGVRGMDIFLKFIPLVGMQMISSSYFQAVGKANQATILSLSRQIIIFIPLLIILPRMWGLEGVWWSAPFSDLGAFVLTGLWLWAEIKQLNKTRDMVKSEV
ncbi:MAG: MATE family efflux transporter [Clostridiales bacterium]|nr:MATE family efflux transporter [Clostridiales bacterium]